MKIRLAVSQERYAELKAILESRGFEIDDRAELVLSESGRFADNLTVRDPVSNARVFLPVGDIVYIETCGHAVEVHTAAQVYQAYDRLYRLCGQLDGEKFLRISNSVVIARDKVRQIASALSMKFVLTMVNGDKVDVTRSYYYIFKESFGI